MCGKYLLSRRQHHALKQEWANCIKLVLNLERKGWYRTHQERELTQCQCIGGCGNKSQK
jgi:hypothetical protein